jgi:hypothetical protein
MIRHHVCETPSLDPVLDLISEGNSSELHFFRMNIYNIMSPKTLFPFPISLSVSYKYICNFLSCKLCWFWELTNSMELNPSIAILTIFDHTWSDVAVQPPELGES